MKHGRHTDTGCNTTRTAASRRWAIGTTCKLNKNEVTAIEERNSPLLSRVHMSLEEESSSANIDIGLNYNKTRSRHKYRFETRGKQARCWINNTKNKRTEEMSKDTTQSIGHNTQQNRSSLHNCSTTYIRPEDLRNVQSICIPHP
jgi:hypothetical protein